MSDAWANFGVDLLLELRGTHRRSAVEDALRDAVRSGRLVAGTPLPSSRTLAVELGLSRNTVADAYGQLVAEGWLTARQGAGTRVAARDLPPAARTTSGTASARVARRRFDLTPGTPDLAGFPRTAWLGAARRAITAAPSEMFGYPDPRGLLGLRESLVQYLARVRGVRTTAENVVVCSGFGQALGLLAATLRRNGATTMVTESYGLALHRELIRAAGLAVRSVGVDSGGARVQELSTKELSTEESSMEVRPAAGALLLTPSHQFPLGVPLTAERRAMALRWAARTGALLIEDDYDGEFRYDRRPIGAMQGLAPDLVAYIGTASKSLAPALGLAWLVVPPALLDDVVEAKRLSDGYTGIFEQLAFADFIDSGAYDRHVRRSRLRYRRRRDLLLMTLARRQADGRGGFDEGEGKAEGEGGGELRGGIRVTGIAAGLHAVLDLPDLRAADEAAIVTRAARAGLSLKGLGFFRHEPDPEAPAGLVIGYATPPEHSYRGALDVLAHVLG